MTAETVSAWQPPSNEVAALRDVSKALAGKLVINSMSLEVPRGEMVLISGPSGSGKSTILRLLANIERPDTGDVNLFGVSLTQAKPKEVQRLIRDRVGLGFQTPNLDKNYSVLDNIELLAEATGHQVDPKRLARLAVGLNIADLLFRRSDSLSGGEQLRTALARSLMSAPELVLLDEPTSMIDPHGKAETLERIREVAKQENATVVMVSHDTDVTREFVDREFVIESGQIIDHWVYEQ